MRITCEVLRKGRFSGPTPNLQNLRAPGQAQEAGCLFFLFFFLFFDQVPQVMLMPLARGLALIRSLSGKLPGPDVTTIKGLPYHPPPPPPPPQLHYCRGDRS